MEKQIKKHLISAYAENNTPEHLAKSLVSMQHSFEIMKNERDWLDSLASHYRDNQKDLDYGRVCQELHSEFMRKEKSINARYYEQKTTES